MTTRHKMKAVVHDRFGDSSVLRIARTSIPKYGDDDLLVEVHAVGVNRGDILQRQGEYVVPKGQSEIMGVEIAGVVVALGENVRGFTAGQRVFGVVSGGGYAEYCALDQGMAIEIPRSWTFAQAAAVSEAGLTANETLFALGDLAAGQEVLIHAAASGVGSMMVQMARTAGAIVYGTVGSEKKVNWIRHLGANVAINYHEDDFATIVATMTGGRGVDVVQDFIGGCYLERNLRCLKVGGRLVVVGLLDGLHATIDLLNLVSRRLQVKGSSLRLRELTERRAVSRRFVQTWLPKFESGIVTPLIASEYDICDVARAHDEMEANTNLGKIILHVC